jgi:transposase
MAMGRNDRDRQETMWIASGEIVRGEGHIFYVALNKLFRRHGFDEFVEGLVEKSGIFADGVGRPSVAPGIYFRMSLVGYFEGLSSERGIAWRCADSMSLREFLGYELTQETPDHSTLSRWRRKLPEGIHRDVFEWVVKMAREEGILKGRKVAIDATTLEANAAMKSIVRKADGATYQDYLKKLAKAEGIENPTPQDLQRMDRKRRGKKVSNRHWKSKTDSHARIARLKDGRTHMAYKLENAMDIESRITVAAEVHAADQADTQTIGKTLLSADEAVMNAGVPGGITDAIADRGYHGDAVLDDLDTRGYRAYIAEPKRRQRNWKTQRRRHGNEVVDRRQQTYANRRRPKPGRAPTSEEASGIPGKGFAHLKRTGGLARVHVRGKGEVTKKVHSHVTAANLGVILHALLGIGTPRSLQGMLRKIAAAIPRLIGSLIAHFWTVNRPRTQFVAWRLVTVVIRHLRVGQPLRTFKPAYARAAQDRRGREGIVSGEVDGSPRPWRVSFARDNDGAPWLPRCGDACSLADSEPRYATVSGLCATNYRRPRCSGDLRAVERYDPKCERARVKASAPSTC